MDEMPLVLPADEYNIELVKNVHPLDWKNPEPASLYNLVVVGAGTAGLVTAAGAAALGAKVALIEKDRLGGECLHTGCVPSKSLIESAKLLARMRRAHELGLHPAEPGFDFAEVMERMRRVIAEVGKHDTPERFRTLGVSVHEGEARFLSPHEL